MEIKVENFSHSNLNELIKDYSHQDKVRFAIYCAELVIDIYESNYDSKAPRFAIEEAKHWVESPTKQNRKAVCDAAVRAAAFAAAFADNYANSAAFAAAAAVSAAEAGGENVKSKIISWLSKNDKKEA